MPAAIESPSKNEAKAADTGPMRFPPVRPPDKPKVEQEEKPTEETAEQKEATQKAEQKSADKIGEKMFKGMPRTKAKEDKPAETDEQKKEREAKEKTAKAKADKEKLSPEEKAKADADEKAAAAKKEEKRALKPRPEKPAKPEVDIEKLVSSTVAATAKAMHKEPAKPSEVDEVPDSRKQEWLAIQKAEEGKTTHKGAAETAKKVFKAEQAYIESWQKENPGKKFNPKSDEHDAWYESNVPEWIEDAVSQGELIDSRKSMESELKASLAKEYEPLKEKLSQLEMRDIERNVLERQAPPAVNQGITSTIHALNPELLKEGVKIADADPVAHEVLLQYGPQITAETNAALLMFATRGASLKDGDAMREKIITATTEMEADILKASDADQTAPDGRTFVALDKWANLSPAEQQKHWTITGELVAMKLANESAQEAKKTYDAEMKRIERLATAQGWHKNGASKESQEKNEAEQEEEADNNGKPRSPSTSAKTVITPGQSNEVNVNKRGVDALSSKWFGK